MRASLVLFVASFAAFCQTAPQPSVSGVTVDRQGQPVRKVRLTLRPTSNAENGDAPVPYGATAGADGKFEFYSVPPGRYRLFAEYAGYLRTNYGAKNVWAAGTILTVENGKPIRGLTIPMRAQAILSGKVTVGGAVTKAALVRLLRQRYLDGRLQHTLVESQTTENGEFRFNRLSPGRYYLAATDFSGPASSLTYYPGVLESDAAEVILLGTGQEQTDIQLPLKNSTVQVRGSANLNSLANLRGSVGFEGLAGAPGIQIELANEATMLRSRAALQADGNFSIPRVGPAKYRLSIQQLPAGAYVKSIFYGEKDALTQDLDLTAGITDTPLRIVVSQAGAQISGVVQGDSVVTLVPEPPQPKQALLYQSVETDANGRFLFRGIRPGKYRVFAWEELEPGTYFDPAVTEPVKERGVLVEVVEGDRKDVAVSRILVDQ